MNDPDDLLLALKSVAEAFAHLGTRYYVGGSIASSFHGASTILVGTKPQPAGFNGPAV